MTNRTTRNTTTRWIALGLSVFSVIGLAACSDPEAREPDAGASAGASSGAHTVSGTMEEVCAAAQKEGELISWNSEDPDTYQKIFAKFAAKYPGIKMTSVNLRPVDIVQRLTTEGQAGRAPEVDTLSLTQEVTLPLIDEGLLDTTIDWASMGVDDEYIGGGGSMIRVERRATGITYNTDLVDPADLPDTWEELINSQWAGKITVDPRGDPLSLLATVWGKDKAIDWITRLKETDKPVVLQGATAGLLTIGSGENLIATNAPQAETQEQQANGAPVEIKFLDVVPAVDYFAAVPKGAPHPNASACWAAWENSDEGREARKEFFKGNVDLPESAGDGEPAVIKDDDDVQLVTDTAKSINEIWTAGS